jgi:hypothetical protein
MSKKDKTASSTTPAVPFDLKITNTVGLLLATLINQEGWTKKTSDVIATSDLLNKGGVPDEKPKTAGDGWGDEDLVVSISETQHKACKDCVTAITEKGRLLPGDDPLLLLRALGYPIPDTEETYTITVPNLAAKHLRDLLTIPETIKTVNDLITGSQVVVKLPTIPDGYTDKSKVDALDEWAKENVTFKLTERQRDLCKSTLKKVAEGGNVRTNRYSGLLFTELGLRE